MNSFELMNMDLNTVKVFFFFFVLFLQVFSTEVSVKYSSTVKWKVLIISSMLFVVKDGELK